MNLYGKLSSMGLFLYREILCYPTPINFNYWYGIGLLLLFLLVNQVLTGIQVGSYSINGLPEISDENIR